MMVKRHLPDKMKLSTASGATADLPQNLNADGGFKVHVQNDAVSPVIVRPLDPVVESTVNTFDTATGSPVPTPSSPWLGTLEDASAFVAQAIVFRGVPAGKTGTIRLTYARSATDPLPQVLNLPLIVSDTDVFIPVPLMNVGKWVKIDFLPDDASITNAKLILLHYRVAPPDLTRFQGQAIGPGEPVKVMLALVEPSIRGARGLLGADRTGSGEAVTANRLKTIDLNWSLYDPNHYLSTTGTGTMTKRASGDAEFKVSVTGQTWRAFTSVSVKYRSASEMHFFLTAAFPVAPTQPTSKVFIGPLSATDGFAWGYSGSTFGLLHRVGSVDTFTPLSDVNGDPLNKSAARSRYSRGEYLETYLPQNLSPLRWLIEWFGAYPSYVQVANPEGNWMNVHAYKWPNTRTTPFLVTPTLPIAVEIYKAAGEASDLSITSGCWEAGNTGAKTEFERILATELRTGEYFLRDDEESNNEGYMGVAYRGALTSLPVWKIIKFVRNPSTKALIAMDFLEDVTWDGRAAAAWVV